MPRRGARLADLYTNSDRPPVASRNAPAKLEPQTTKGDVRMHLSIHGAIAAAALAIAGAASAGNLLLNPDFTAGRDGWNLDSATGHVYLIEDNGFPSPPSIRVSGTISITGASAASACVPIDDSLTYDLAFNTEPISGVSSGTVLGYSDASCETQVFSASTGELPFVGNLWTTVTLNDIALAGRSARVVLNASARGFGRGDAAFDHVAFGAHGTLDDGINLNQEGLTGAWYDQDLPGQGFQFSIVDGLLFGAWYTYDGGSGGGPERQRWYSLIANVPGEPTQADITIYENTGGNFDAPPSTSASPVGTATLVFESCTSAHFAFAFDDGRSGNIPLHNLLPNVECIETGVPEMPPSDFGDSGTWYDPTAGGQGMMFSINPAAERVFGGWYTYTPNGAGGGEEEQRWYSLQGRYIVGHASMDVPIYVSTGGTFSDVGTVSTFSVGQATLTFLTCYTAKLDYTFDDGELDGRSGTIPLVRLGAAPASCAIDP